MMNRVELKEEMMTQVNGGALETNLPNSKSKNNYKEDYIKKGFYPIGHLEADEENHKLVGVRD